MANTCLLQGPVGPFFRCLAEELLKRGDRVWQVAFNGGDAWFAHAACLIHYPGDQEAWVEWLEAHLRKWRIDRLFLFGDCRPLHRLAIQVCRRLDIPVWVVEEGYFRPFYLTIEAGGVNGFSPLPRDPAFYRALPEQDEPPVRSFRGIFARRTLNCISYYLAMALARGRYPGYRHFRREALLPEGGCWWRSLGRHLLFRVTERHALQRLRGRPYFLFPLQVQGDSQIIHHSQFASIEDSITTVVASFAAHAPATARLVVKHHPMDRGYHDYTALLHRLAGSHGLGDRLVYLHDAPLPALLARAKGVVTVNSTVGLSALVHHRPTIALGAAIYRMPGLTHQGTLDSFWGAPSPVDRALFAAFRRHVIRTTQLNATSAQGGINWQLLDELPGFWSDPPRLSPVGSPVASTLDYLVGDGVGRE